MLKPDPADDMGGITKDYMKNPPEAVSRFLKARNVVHMPDATDPSIVEHALRKRKTIRVLQLPGTIWTSLDLSTLDYLDVHMGDMDPDEAEIFAAFPAFMDGTNQPINYLFQSTWAKFVYIFRKGRMKDDLAKAAEARTARDWPFGEIVDPFVNGDWDTSYYGTANLSEDHMKNYSAWVISNSHGEQPGNNPIAHMSHPNPNRYWAPRSKIDPSGSSPSDQDNQNQIFFRKEYEKVERNPTKRDQEAERLGLIEASHELVGDHRVLEASPAVDEPGKERQAAEFYLVNLQCKLLRSLMEYSPTSPYWEPVSQLKALEYWMRTPFYPQEPEQAHEIK